MTTTDLVYQGAEFIFAKKYDRALQCLEEARANNSTDAMVLLGDIYFDGNGVEIDFNKAKENYEQVNELNDSNGAVRIGNMCYYGKGVEKDYLKVKEYYESAIGFKNTNDNAYHNLADLYLNRYGVNKDTTKAKEYLELSTQYGNKVAPLKLGSMYLNGNGVLKHFNI